LKRPRVLITDAEERGALAACRSLHAAGYRVAAAAATRLAVGLWSRSVSDRLQLPSPREAARRYVDHLGRELRAGTFDVLVAGSEASLIPISEHRSYLEDKVLLGLPPHETVLRSLDKVLLQEEAAAAGLAPPTAFACSSAEEAHAAARNLGYPVVTKPQRTFAAFGGQLQESAATVVRDERALEQAVALLGVPLVVQQYLEHPKVVFCAAVRLPERLLGFTFARIRRTWRPDAGTATMAETLDPPPGVEEKVEELLSRIGWVGIFQLLLLDLGDGRLAAIDLNPRLFASLALPVHAGSNLPALWCDHLLGRPSSPPERVRAGIRYRWEDGEARYAIRSALRGELRETLSVLRPYRRVAHGYFDLLDPGPFLAQALIVVLDQVHKVLARLRGTVRER
jgi:predicted ATP-grasp superfamily ATP-dependent carboligase